MVNTHSGSIVGRILGDKTSKNKNEPTYKVTDVTTKQTVFIPEHRFDPNNFVGNPNIKIRRLEDRG
jgi:hypothetical protein